MKPSPKRRANGRHKSSNEEEVKEEADEGVDVSTSGPSRKKQKRDPSIDADAKLAAELQAQENQLARARTTRGNGRAAKPAKKKAPRKKSKSATKVKTDDDSGVEASESSVPPKRKAGGGFQKPFNLSPQLSDVVAETQVCVPAKSFTVWIRPY